MKTNIKNIGPAGNAPEIRDSVAMVSESFDGSQYANLSADNHIFTSAYKRNQSLLAYALRVANKLGKDMAWVPLSPKQAYWLSGVIFKCARNGIAGITIKNNKGRFSLFIQKEIWPKINS